MADLDPCAPLCVCGTRDCPAADLHATAYTTPSRKRWRKRHRR